MQKNMILKTTQRNCYNSMYNKIDFLIIVLEALSGGYIIVFFNEKQKKSF